MNNNVILPSQNNSYLEHLSCQKVCMKLNKDPTNYVYINKKEETKLVPKKSCPSFLSKRTDLQVQKCSGI